MAKVKNVSGKVRLIPSMGWRRVEVGALLEVKPEEVYGFTCQPANWAPGDADAKKAHKAATEPADDNENESEES